jgi:molybdopterin-guanine dinucleotide biosynthesis protein A
MNTEAAILAGGQARRLGGRDKRALLVGGRPILEHQVSALRPVVARIVIVGGPPDPFIGIDLPIVQDLVPGAGALGGIYTTPAGARAERVLVLACDMPFVTTEFLGFLATAGREADVTLPRDAHGLHPLCAAWSAAAAPAVGELVRSGVRKVRDALDVLRVHIVEGRELEAFDPEGRLLINVNTPGDHARAIEEGASGAQSPES